MDSTSTPSTQDSAGLQTQSNQLAVRPEVKPITQALLKSLEDQDKFKLVRISSKLDLIKARLEGTNIRTLKIIYKDEPEVLETVVYKILELGRDLLMIKDSDAQQLVLMNAAIDIIDNDQNGLFTLEEIVYCIQKGSTGKYDINREYGKLNSEVINLWLDELYREHLTQIEAEHQSAKALNESTRSKSPILTNSFDDLVRNQVRIQRMNDKKLQE